MTLEGKNLFKYCRLPFKISLYMPRFFISKGQFSNKNTTRFYNFFLVLHNSCALKYQGYSNQHHLFTW